MRNLTNSEGDIYINTLADGEAIEIVQVGNTTQTVANVSMKTNTTQATSLNDTDILIIADGTTGKVVQYITVGDLKTATSYTGTAPIVINNRVISYDNTTAGEFFNKTFGDFTIFKNSLKVKSTVANASGAVYFEEASNNGTNSLQLLIENNSLASGDISVFLPNSKNNTILIGKDTTDTLTNKTITSFTGGSSAVITAPSTTGTLTINNPHIVFGDLGSGATSISYIYDPGVGAVSTTNNAIAFHSNGTEVDLNCRISAGGISSAINFKFTGNKLWIFNQNLTMVVGSNSYSFPSTGGQLALFTQIPTNNNQLSNGAGYITSASIPSAIWVVNANQIYPVSSGVTILKMNTIQNTNYPSTKLEENGAYGWRMLGNNPIRILALYNPLSTYYYPFLGNNAGGFVLHINNVGDVFTIDTSRNATLYGNRLDIGAAAGTHLRLETVSTNNHYLTDPNSGVSSNNHILYYNTAATLSILNSGSANGECRMTIAGADKFSVTSGVTKVFTSEFVTPRFRIVSNGSETYINNPEGTTTSPFLTYHQNGTNLDFTTPVGGYANTSYIRHYIGSQLKLFIGGASTINYNPMVIEGDLTLTTNGDLTMYNGNIVMNNGNINITGNINGTNCEMDIDGGVNCLGGVSANILGGKVGFQDTLPGYGTNLYGVVVAEQTYGYFATQTVPGTGLGGSYDAYWGGGSIGGTSDIRMKKNINTIENPIDIIKRLRGVNFEWNCEGKPKGVQIGYIAQEVKEVIPSIVDFLPTKCEMCPDGTYGVAPMNITAVLVEGIKAQQIEIDTLKTELDTVKTELDTVKTELDTLKTENQIYKSIVDKLLIAPSFKSFKESLI